MTKIYWIQRVQNLEGSVGRVIWEVSRDTKHKLGLMTRSSLTNRVYSIDRDIEVLEEVR